MERDRVSVSMSVKIGLPKYGSADVQISYASSAQENEQPDALYHRVSAYVEEKLELAKEKLMKSREDALEEVEIEESKSQEQSISKKGLGGLGRLKFLKKRQETSPGSEKIEEPSNSFEEAANLTPVRVQEASTVPKEAVTSAEEASEDSSSALNRSKIEELRKKYNIGGKTSGTPIFKR